MNLLLAAPVRTIPLIRAAILAGLLAGSAGGWPPPAPGTSSRAPHPAAPTEDFLGFFPADDRTGLPGRQEEFRAVHRRATIIVFPIRLGRALDTAGAVSLARTLPLAGICRTTGVARPVEFAAARPEAGDKALWETAREFRDHVRQNPTGADYALFAEYVLTAERSELAAVHLVLCDAQGEWVIVDRQESGSAGFPGARVSPQSEGEALVVRRLQSYLAGPPTEASHLDSAGATRPPIARTTPSPFPP
jgi:hypothetical protein